MARSSGNVINNNFSKGVVTEATGLNFPENASTEAENVIFEAIGSVKRRLGFDVSLEAVPLAYTNSVGPVKEFLWQSVANNGQFTYLVLQVGRMVYFKKLDDNGGDINFDGDLDSIDIGDYATDVSEIAEHFCSFSSGAGFLFIAHPYCNPLLVRWNEDTSILQIAPIEIRVRDFVGVEDGLGFAENPSSLSTEHLYNLKNQGWFQSVRVGSTSNEIGTGVSTETPAHPLNWTNIT
jgi:hypothetical protein